MIPAELLKIQEDFDPEDLYYTIQAVEYSAQNIRITLHIATRFPDGIDGVNEEWLIDAIGVRENTISIGSIDRMYFSDDDALLWKYTDLPGSLYYTGTCQDIGKLFMELYLVHFGLFDDHIPFSEFLNMTDLRKLFRMPMGLLAKGPLKLLERYAVILQECGIEPSIVKYSRPTVWDGNSHVPKQEDLKILLFPVENCFIIAEEFQFTRSKNSPAQHST